MTCSLFCNRPLPILPPTHRRACEPAARFSSNLPARDRSRKPPPGWRATPGPCRCCWWLSRAERVGVLNQRAKNLRAESKRAVVIDDNVDAERPGAGLDDFNVLRMTVLRDEENVAAFLVFEAVAHHHRFRRGGGFVEQRGVG